MIKLAHVHKQIKSYGRNNTVNHYVFSFIVANMHWVRSTSTTAQLPTIASFTITDMTSHRVTRRLGGDGEKLTSEERRRRRRATSKYRTAHACRERVRVEAFNIAFQQLRQLLPTLPPDKKMSKIEILRLAICYISYLSHMLRTDS